MKFSIQTLIWSAVILAMLLAGGFALIPKPVDVEYAEVVEGDLIVTVQEDGKTRIREKYIVSAPVSGRVSRSTLNAGDGISGEETLLAVIQPGDPAMLDARARAQADAKVLSAEAALQRTDSNSQQAKINLDLAKAKFDRVETLLETKAISREEYDIVKAEYLASVQAEKAAKFDAEIATFELEMARAAASQFNGTQAETSVEPFEMHAPIFGKVLRVFQESAAVVTVGTPLFELGDPTNLEIEIDVLSTDAVRIKPGAELEINHWGGETPLQGKVRVIEPAAFTKTSSLGVEEQRVNIIADFTEPRERIETLGDGYRVEASITVDKISQALLVPNSALFRYRRAWHVMAIVDNRAVLTQVIIGLQNESKTQILKGLEKGAQVIVYPSDQVQSGTKVRLVTDSISSN